MSIAGSYVRRYLMIEIIIWNVKSMLISRRQDGESGRSPSLRKHPPLIVQTSKLKISCADLRLNHPKHEEDRVTKWEFTDVVDYAYVEIFA